MAATGGAFVLVVALAGAACSTAPPSGMPPVVWTAPSLIRIGQEDLPRAGDAALLTAARGEYESFQIVVSGGGEPVSVDDVVISELEGPGGAVIAAENVTRYREQYVEVDRGTPDRGGSNPPLGEGVYADGLVPFTDPDSGAALAGEVRALGVTIAPGENQPYWVDVFVPSDVPAGEYTGTWEVSTGWGDFDGPVTLTVLDLTLPDAPLLPTAFLNSSGTPAIDRELVRNRLMPGSSVEGLGPLAADPRVTAINTGFYSGADRETCRMDPPPAPTEITARAAGVSGLVYNYTADEVRDCDGLIPQLQEWARTLHAAGVKQLVTIPPDPALFTDGAGAPGVDIWAVLPKDFDPATIDQMRRADPAMQLWSYTAVAQDGYSPKWLIDFSPVNFRILPGFLNHSQGVTGTLYWRVDNWGDDPWRTAVLYDGRFPGDGMLVYPGDRVGMPGGAAPSIRLKWIRDGVEDYAYAQLAQRVDADAALRVARSVGQDWRTWSDDPAELLRARNELAVLAQRTGN